MDNSIVPAQFVIALAAVAAALGCVLIGVNAFSRTLRSRRASGVLERALDRQSAPVQKDDANRRPFPRFFSLTGMAHVVGSKWLESRLGRMIVADEDRRLLDRCGHTDASSRARFLAARLVASIVLPAFVVFASHGNVHGSRFMLTCFAALLVGFMAPKWYVKRKATKRQRSIIGELPMFVDLLRILQGVGLSLDQSISVIVSDFAKVMPILTQELALAQRQYATGRTREQAMKRLATSYESDDLAAVLRLMIQIEQHGGAVQEPLRQFGDRLREMRRTGLRERIGKLTVKMTGVMVLTLLPALLIMTAGPGFIAVFHSLAGLHR
ncbi:type II secretion system F family protein [Caballeronia sp. LP006]|jgi:tight adherence protein C|uniref:type II secretion system F family protein n=1 Tax=unclassified Caballeronia TaxID=2646786 RepID=UPI001FCFD994|nr:MULTISPECIES: type II secretion system F family protein [unclassified Caballeronia]MDR5773652.1 type II secretion system F family protein [Caballeronia sp. LZ002]MDR5805633.1 type II secretion system F family protein [Caballeronia sp. LZ001]MDR5826876.1 type II secretion system F family protein [Caballeronia sp. LP006]MDR5849086.1 type II secretion system F family protein [Caballeronia sp. LZ003]